MSKDDLEEIVEEDYKKLYEKQKYVTDTLHEFSNMLVEDPLNENNEQKYYEFVLKKVANLINFKHGGVILIRNENKKPSNFGSVLKEGKYSEDVAFFGLTKDLKKSQLNKFYNLYPMKSPALLAIKLKKPIQICNNKKVLKKLEKEGILASAKKHVQKIKEFYEREKNKKEIKENYGTFDEFFEEVEFPLLYKNDVLGVINFDAPKKYNINEEIPKPIIDAGMEITNCLIPSIMNGMRQNRIKKGTELFVPEKRLVRLFIENPSKFKELMEGGEWKVSNLFIDIKSYSKYAEEKTGKEVVSKLREYYEVIGKIAEEDFGAISPMKEGDGAYYLFNGMKDQEDHANIAVECAICMQEGIKKLNKRWKEEGKEEFISNIGINTGEDQIGNYYREKSIVFSAIGNSVNIASRLSGVSITKLSNSFYKLFNITKKDGRILISDSTYSKLDKSKFKIKYQGKVKVKNMKPIKAYQIDY